jgi:threonine dehydratase
VPPATPLEKAPEPLAPGVELFLKREDTHELGAFKWRAALPVLEGFRARGAAGVVTASTGNHGAATAWAARRLGMSAEVFAPEGASRTKLARIEELGAAIHLAPGDFDEAKETGRRYAAERGLAFFEDGAEEAQYDAYRSIAAEILEQIPRPPRFVVVPVGNGALIGGIGLELKERSPETRVIGAVAKEAPVMALSFEARKVVECRRMATFADGLAVRVAIPYAVDAIGRVVDRVVLVSEREIAAGVADFARVGLRAEGAAGAGLAAVRKLRDISGPVVLVVTGRNIDEELHRRAVERSESFPA